MNLRESVIVPELDRWLARVFDPANIDQTCESLAAAQRPVDEDLARAEAARRKLAGCDDRLAKYRAALEAGADPTVVAGWMAEVQGPLSLGAELELARATPADTFNADDIRALVEALAPIDDVLARAEHEQKARLYNELGLELTFDVERRVVRVDAAPSCTYECVGGGT